MTLKSLNVAIFWGWREFFFIEILQWLKKIGAVHLIKLHDGEGRKYPEIPRVKYLVFTKCGTKYQKWDRILI